MIIDTHCHLTSEYYSDIDSVILDNRHNGIGKIIVSACEIGKMEEALFLADHYDDVFLSLGFHPSEALKVTSSHFDQLTESLKHPHVVAIGEIGLDYHYDRESKDKQKELFHYQLSLAEYYHLPVIIHSRDATQDTIDILKQHHVSGIIHCFSGSLEVALQYIQMGFLLGIGGVITFKNSNLGQVVSKIPLSSIVLETDSPYLTPVPHRGEINSSKYLPIIAEKIAEVKKVSIQEVITSTTNNATGLFDFS